MPEAVEVPISQLSEAALQGIVEEFITREGTDYGHRDWTMAQKVAQVRAQLEAGDARIVFDPVTETCTLLGPVNRL